MATKKAATSSPELAKAFSDIFANNADALKTLGTNSKTKTKSVTGDRITAAIKRKEGEGASVARLRAYCGQLRSLSGSGVIQDRATKEVARGLLENIRVELHPTVSPNGITHEQGVTIYTVFCELMRALGIGYVKLGAVAQPVIPMNPGKQQKLAYAQDIDAILKRGSDQLVQELWPVPPTPKALEAVDQGDPISLDIAKLRDMAGLLSGLQLPKSTSKKELIDRVAASRIRNSLLDMINVLNSSIKDGGVDDATGSLVFCSFKNLMNVLGYKAMASIPEPTHPVSQTKAARRESTRALAKVLLSGINLIDVSLNAGASAPVIPVAPRVASFPTPRKSVIRARGKTITIASDELYHQAGYAVLAGDNISAMAKAPEVGGSVEKLVERSRERTLRIRQQVLYNLKGQLPEGTTPDNLYLREVTCHITNGVYELVFELRFVSNEVTTTQSITVKITRTGCGTILQHIQGLRTGDGARSVDAIMEAVQRHNQMG